MQEMINSEAFRSPMVMPGNVAKLKMSRKLIYQEFGVKLSFQQEDFVDMVQYYAAHSDDPRLKRLAMEIDRFMQQAA